jgi:hypothetical protein
VLDIGSGITLTVTANATNGVTLDKAIIDVLTNGTFAVVTYGNLILAYSGTDGVTSG